MTQTEALKLALEALEDRSSLMKWQKAINAVKAALEVKGELVVCRACNGSGRIVRDPDIGTDQECFVCDGSGVFEDTTPPQRKPLTDAQIADIVIEMNGNEPPALFWKDLTRAIEAAHGIKGEA
jgi:hypothetical protein